MRFIIPIFLIIIAFGLFFSYIDPTYDTIEELNAKVAEFDAALSRSNELTETLNGLLVTYNNFSTADLGRIEKLLPDNVDSVRLIIDIDSIATQNGLQIKDLNVSTAGGEKKNQELGIVNLNFSISSSYETLKQFLVDLEDSLRILDITSLSFDANKEDFAKYSIAIKTYWLR